MDNNTNAKANKPAEVSQGVEKDTELMKEYVDKRTVIISLARNYSNYRKVNMKVFGLHPEVIGSSINSSKILSSNRGELEKYYPSILGCASNNPDFITKVKHYLNNFRLIVPDSDVKLDVSFRYDTKKDYLDFKAKEDAIEDDFSKADKSNITALKKAVDEKVRAINLLESSKYTVGSPVNVESYLMYRHCLLYPDVAKDMSLINSSTIYRFYIKDADRELEKQKKLIEEKKKAMANYMEINKVPSKYEAVLINIVSSTGGNVASVLGQSSMEKDQIIMDYVNNSPDKFNKLVNDKNFTTVAFIERLISRNELIRSEYNQQITAADGTFIGSNMNEAIGYFNNPANAEIKTAYENKLKLN